MRRVLWLSVVFLSLPRLALPAQSAASTFAVTGRVQDQTGAPIAGAAVSLSLAGSQGQVASTRTDGRGEFSLTVRPGTYSLTIASAGFVTAAFRVADEGRGSITHDVVLQIAGVRETVSINAPAPYRIDTITAGMKAPTPLRDIPQSVTVVTRDLMQDQLMSSMADVVRYVPGAVMAQGEGNRDAVVLRGNASTSDFFVDGIRDDVQYFRDIYNIERVEAFKGPNAMAFGRGGVGGVINRVTRQASSGAPREMTAEFGSWSHRRVTADVGGSVNARSAVRLAGVYENSDSYRNGVGLERYGINPTASFVLGPATTLRAGYEYFHDDRTADRGIPSFDGRPVETDASTFFGNADLSDSVATVNSLSAALEHRVGTRLTIRNHTSYRAYDKFYQNVFPAGTDATGTEARLSAYNNATDRHNVFNQTDLVLSQRTGAIGHTIAAGLEFGRQATDNFRTTGFFSPVLPVTTISVPLSNPVTTAPIDFRQSATDADNHGVATTGAAYIQDQVAFTDRVQAVVGLRYDRFSVDFVNHRTGENLTSHDDLLAPRLGLIVKPVAPLSLYSSYSLTYLPRAGEQLASLSLTTRALDPEQFRNYEAGAKWDVAPALSLTAAVYRLDRRNVAVPDPENPAVSLLVDAQRSKGLELGVNGSVTPAWSVAGGYAYQQGEITRSLSAGAQAGATLAQLPPHTFSLWNRVAPTWRWGAGLGLIYRAAMFTATDNAVEVPSFTRVDAAGYFAITRQTRAQLNVENLFDRDYYISAHSNQNITPGSPLSVRVSLVTRF